MCAWRAMVCGVLSRLPPLLHDHDARQRRDGCRRRAGRPDRCIACAHGARWCVASCRGCRRSYMITMHGNDAMAVVGGPEGPTGALHVRMARDGGALSRLPPLLHDHDARPRHDGCCRRAGRPDRCIACAHGARWCVASCRGCRRSYMITMHGRDTMGVVGGPEGPTGALHVHMARDGVWRLVAAAAARA